MMKYIYLNPNLNSVGVFYCYNLHATWLLYNSNFFKFSAVAVYNTNFSRTARNPKLGANNCRTYSHELYYTRLTLQLRVHIHKATYKTSYLRGCTPNQQFIISLEFHHLKLPFHRQMLKEPGHKSLGLYISYFEKGWIGGVTYVQKYVQQNLRPQYYKTQLF